MTVATWSIIRNIAIIFCSPSIFSFRKHCMQNVFTVKIDLISWALSIIHNFWFIPLMEGTFVIILTPLFWRLWFVFLVLWLRQVVIFSNCFKNFIININTFYVSVFLKHLLYPGFVFVKFIPIGKDGIYSIMRGWNNPICTTSLKVRVSSLGVPYTMVPWSSLLLLE